MESKISCEGTIMPPDKHGCTIDAGYEISPGGTKTHVRLRPQDVRSYIENLRKKIADLEEPQHHVKGCRYKKIACLGCIDAESAENYDQLVEMLAEEREPTPALLEAGRRYNEMVIGEDICSTCKKKGGKQRVDNGLGAGIHCDDCWNEMLREARRGSW